MVTWVLQTNLIDQNQVSEVAFAAKDAGASVIAATIIPFSEEIQMESLPVNDLVIPYGSTKLSRLADEHKWKGMFFDRELFSVPTWLANRDDMLNSNVTIMSVAALQTIGAELGNDDDVYFIRPIEDLKAFNGTVTNVKEIRRWMSSVESGSFNFSTDTLVAISPAQTIQGEWRWFIVNGKVVSGSMYRMNGQRLVQRATEADIVVEAQKKADQWLPNQTCVMDLALTSEGVKVIEFNCFNSSGFYYHDIPRIVKAVTQHVGTL